LEELSNKEKAILNLIRTHNSLSRSQISKLTNYSSVKVINVIGNLEKSGTLQRIVGSSSGGRKPVLYKLKDDICFSMGIEIAASNIRVAIVNVNGDIVAQIEHYVPLTKKRTLSTADIVDVCNKVLRSMNFEWSNIFTIGLGVAGFVDQENGRCHYILNVPNWENLEIVKELEEKTGVKKINLTDNIKAITWSETIYGFGKEFSTFILFCIGAGLGAGIVIDNKLYCGTSPDGIVGEIGHTYVGESSEICVCGNYGCLESMASGWAMVERAKKAIARGVFTSLKNLTSSKESISVQDIIKAADEGDKFAINLIEETAEYLSVAISSLINTLTPQAIIVAGELAKKAGDLLMIPLLKGIKAKTIPWLRKRINVKNSEQDVYTAARGSAVLALDKFFDTLF